MSRRAWLGKARKMRAAGVPIAEIAAEIGVSRAAVYNGIRYAEDPEYRAAQIADQMDRYRRRREDPEFRRRRVEVARQWRLRQRQECTP